MQRVTIQAVKGGVTVNTGGQISTTIVEGSFPGCTVSVFNTGTVNLATIFGDNLFPPTPKANPFVADQNGFGFFYAANGSRVDVQLSGTGVTTPFIVAGDILLDDPSLLAVMAPQTVTFSATPTFDLSQASWFKLTLTGNVTGPAFSNPVTGSILILSLAQNAAGGWTFAFPAAFPRPPVIALAANAVTELTFKYDGTNWTPLAASGDNTTIPTQLLASSGTAALPSIALAASQTTGFFRQAADVIGVSIAAVLKWLINSVGLLFGSGEAVAWSSNGDPSAAPGDTFLARIGATILALGSANGSVDGELRLAKVNKITLTQPASGAVLTLADGKTITISKTLTFTGTDGTTHTFPATNSTLARTDAGQTFTGVQVMSSPTINGTPTGTGIPTVTLKKGTGAGNYTTASTTYVVVDSTNLCYTVTIPTGWKLLVQASGALGTSTAVVQANVALTDNAACGTANAGILVQQGLFGPSAGNGTNFSLSYVINGDGASHSVALQFSTSNGADSAVIANVSASFTVTMVFILTPSN